MGEGLSKTKERLAYHDWSYRMCPNALRFKFYSVDQSSLTFKINLPSFSPENNLKKVS